MIPPDPGPGRMLTDLEARAYAHLAPVLHANAPDGLLIPDELARVLLDALDDLNARRTPSLTAAVRAAGAAADRVRTEEDAEPLTIAERARALGRRLDFNLVAGSNLEVAELARAYVELERLAPFEPPPELELEEDTRDVVVDAAAAVRDVIVEHDVYADNFTGRLAPLGNALNALGEALDVHESA